MVRRFGRKALRDLPARLPLPVPRGRQMLLPALAMYSVCKARYSDPSSWRHGTVDGAVVDNDRLTMLFYSVVRVEGRIAEIHTHPCREGITFEQLRDTMKAGAAMVEEPLELICVENLTHRRMVAAIRQDVPKGSKHLAHLVPLMAAVKECFAR